MAHSAPSRPPRRPMLPPMLCGDDLTPSTATPSSGRGWSRPTASGAAAHPHRDALVPGWQPSRPSVPRCPRRSARHRLRRRSRPGLRAGRRRRHGPPDFAALSARAGCRSAAAVRRATATAPALLLAFDVLVLNGRDLRPLPWQERHAHLTQLGLGPSVTPGAPGLAYLEAHDDGPALIRATHDLGLEGVVAKHRHSPYLGRRAATWVKVKHAHARDVAGAPLRGWRRAS
jgi:hypothetical protein